MPQKHTTIRNGKRLRSKILAVQFPDMPEPDEVNDVIVRRAID